MKSFVGRTAEIKVLKDFLDNREAGIAVIYGRRRIGKSFLIAEACKGRNKFNFEGLEQGRRPAQIRNFLFQLQLQTASEIKSKSAVNSWSEALAQLLPFLTDHSNPVLVLDEFQWMAKYNSSLVVELKMLYDQFFSRIPGFKLILCGSIASFMIKRVVNSKAFYGRVDTQIHLEELSLAEARQFLPSHSLEDCLLAYLTLGGVPKYLSLIQSGESIPAAIQRLIFEKVAPLRDEFDKIFVSHFGKKSSYQSIVRLLGQHPYGLSHKQISEQASTSGGGQTTRELYDLEMAGFIKSYVPFDKTLTSKTKRYKLVDAFSFFYIKFAEPCFSKGLVADFFNAIYTQPAFQSWLGSMFELACLKQSRGIAKILGFSGISFSFGPFWRSAAPTEEPSQTGVQFDLVFSRADKVLTVCEVKYSVAAIGVEVGKRFKEQIANTPELNNRTVQTVLITTSAATKELIQGAYFNKIILASELFEE